MAAQLPPEILKLRETYQQAQARLIDIIAKQEAKGNITTYRKRIMAQINAELQALDKFAAEWSAETVEKYYKESVEKVYALYREANIPAPVVAVNQRAISLLASRTTEQLMAAHHHVGRMINDQIRAAGVAAVREKIAAGDTVKQAKANLIGKLTDKGVMGIRYRNGRWVKLDSYAELVARTTTREATNKATTQQLQDMGQDLVQISTTFSTCPVCVTGDSVVSGPKAVLGMRRKYSGDIVSISTAFGNRLSGTPEHAILTGKGWVKLQDIEPGDEIISKIDVDTGIFAGSVAPDKIQMPSRIDDVCKTFSPIPKINIFDSPAGCDLNDDIMNGVAIYQPTNSKIGVVGSNCGLMKKLYASLGKFFRYNFFTCRIREAFRLLCKSSSKFCFVGMMTTAPSLVRSTSKIISEFFSRVFIHSDRSLFGFFGTLFKSRVFSISNKSTTDRSCFDAGSAKIVTDRPVADSECGTKLYRGFSGNIPGNKIGGLSIGQRSVVEGSERASFFDLFSDPSVADTKGGSELVSRLSGYVSFDKIVNVDVSVFTGHVYDLQTKCHWYIANNIITHNCAVYEGRVYSISGKSKEYPPLDAAFRGGYSTIHPNCSHSVTSYVVEKDFDAEKTREYSNRPFEIDPEKQKSIDAYNKDQAKKAERRKDRNEWEKAKLVVPGLTPKTFSGYRATKRADTDRYKLIKAKL